MVSNRGAAIFPLHAIPVEILRPWKKKCLAELGIFSQCMSLKLGIHLKQDISQILIIGLHGLSAIVTTFSGATPGVLVGQIMFFGMCVFMGLVAFVFWAFRSTDGLVRKGPRGQGQDYVPMDWTGV
ncbi:hypothetical protein L1987_13160 [Smallanthus sonchifolius]|uniref:Uncharacterized protein n=2 Tax=Smallanthus sonchifolius TaxID=185202 RepID=A0ACB9JGC2_9ASTR|nr:hypothetical protein L1987_13157 [Smallanthus sonchifolius]KAI3819333.1 hypothetical protein L1987_13160 [Smallanthus sonchifolius]